VDNFHKVPVIIQKNHRCECDLTLWPSYFLCDYRAVTYKEETFCANAHSPPIAEQQWPTCTWHRDSRDCSSRTLTKFPGTSWK